VLLGAEEASDSARVGVGMPLEIFGGECAASFGEGDFLSGGNGGGEGARGELETIGGPGVGLLLGAGVEDNQEARELEGGFFEAAVAGDRIEVAGVAEFESGKRAVSGERFPERACVGRDAASGVCTVEVVRAPGG